MKKIFIVTSGSHSDYTIEGVFENADEAKRVSKLIFEGRVEEYPLNQSSDNSFLYPWRVWMEEDGKVLDSSLRIEAKRKAEYKTGGGYIDAYVLARDKEHAIKIVNDWRTRKIALGELGKEK